MHLLQIRLMDRRPRVTPLFWAATALLLLAVTGLAYATAPEGEATPDRRVVGADLDGDGRPEDVVLDRGPGAVWIQDGERSYRVRTKWKVLEGDIADTDHDGAPEVVCLVQDTAGRHLALFAWRSDRYRERLVTAPLAFSPGSLRVISDPAGGGGDALELTEEDGSTVVYRWNGFGFTTVAVQK
jgi:hypothetical protein